MVPKWKSCPELLNMLFKAHHSCIVQKQHSQVPCQILVARFWLPDSGCHRNTAEWPYQYSGYQHPSKEVTLQSTPLSSSFYPQSSTLPSGQHLIFLLIKVYKNFLLTLLCSVIFTPFSNYPLNRSLFNELRMLSGDALERCLRST